MKKEESNIEPYKYKPIKKEETIFGSFKNPDNPFNYYPQTKKTEDNKNHLTDDGDNSQKSNNDKVNLVNKLTELSKHTSENPEKRKNINLKESQVPDNNKIKQKKRSTKL